MTKAEIASALLRASEKYETESTNPAAVQSMNSTMRDAMAGYHLFGYVREFAKDLVAEVERERHWQVEREEMRQFGMDDQFRAALDGATVPLSALQPHNSYES